MSTALVQHDAEREQVELVKRTISPKGELTDHELKLFLYTAKRHGLDPLARQIYAVKRKNKDGSSSMTIQTGIDGYRAIADRTNKYAGNDDYEFDDANCERPKWAKATVYKIVEGLRCPFSATARWDQYFPGESQGWAWKKMPHVMLGKCAEALALRKAFPSDLSGLYTTEEMQQADSKPMSRKQAKELQEEKLKITDEDVSQAIQEEPPSEEELEENKLGSVVIVEGRIQEVKGFETCSVAKVDHNKIVVVDDKLQAEFRMFFNDKDEVSIACLEKISPKDGSKYLEARTVKSLLHKNLDASLEDVKKRKNGKIATMSSCFTHGDYTGDGNCPKCG